jgi:hypothetical protein
MGWEFAGDAESSAISRITCQRFYRIGISNGYKSVGKFAASDRGSWVRSQGISRGICSKQIGAGSDLFSSALLCL